MQASITDAAGNTSTANSSGIIDTVAPVIAVNELDLGNDGTAVISGTSTEPVGSVVSILITDVNGITYPLSAVVDNTGVFQTTSPTLPDGSYSVQASITDAAGNTSTANSSGIIDTVAPVIAVNELSLGNDGTAVISGTSTEPVGSVVSILITDVNGITYPLSAVVDNNGVFQTTSPTLPDGSYSVQASITDAAGNTSTANSSGIIDTVAPVIAVNELSLGNDGTAVISGTSTEPVGSVVSILITDVNGI
ncbi:Ig-like domain-containing protein, partial [Pseudoalteromonas sp. Z9A5]|uniref:Ig-like domain-containing protein n=1 Tax=Pseudoalteromonas sp. Z9A5 TaxID=2686355 RepID=UPI00197EC694